MRIFLTQNQIVNQVNIFLCGALRGLPLSVSLSFVPMSLNFFIRLLMLLIVRHSFGNSFNNSIALYLFK